MLGESAVAGVPLRPRCTRTRGCERNACITSRPRGSCVPLRSASQATTRRVVDGCVMRHEAPLRGLAKWDMVVLGGVDNRSASGIVDRVSSSGYPIETARAHGAPALAQRFCPFPRLRRRDNRGSGLPAARLALCPRARLTSDTPVASPIWHRSTHLPHEFLGRDAASCIFVCHWARGASNRVPTASRRSSRDSSECAARQRNWTPPIGQLGSKRLDMLARSRGKLHVGACHEPAKP